MAMAGAVAEGAAPAELGLHEAPENLMPYVAACAGILVFGALVSYSLLPHVMPTEERKTGFWSFVFGTSTMRYYRGPGDKPFTQSDFPQSGGTASYGLARFASEFESLWTPAKETSLRDAVLRHMLPWYAYSHVLLGLTKFLGLVVGAQMMNFVVAFVKSPVLDMTDMLQLQALGFFFAVAVQCVPCWQGEIVALRATDPLASALNLAAVRKVQRLSLEGLARTDAAEAQQIVQETGALSFSLWLAPLKCILADVFLGVAALYELRRTLGLTCVLLSLVVMVALGVGVGAAEARKVEHEKRIYEHTLARQTTLEMLLGNFRSLRAYGWVARVARPLGEERANIRRERLRATLWTTVSTLLGSQIFPAVTLVTLYVSVFVNGGKVSFEQGARDTACIGLVMTTFQAIGGAIGHWFDIATRAARIEAFLRLPEAHPTGEEGGELRLTGASFAWPEGKVPGETRELALREITLAPVKQGDLVLVSGAVGSGKSSLLLALLGELTLMEGSASRPKGVVAYQPQQPSLMDGTIRHNVTFGLPPGGGADDAHMQAALEAAQLACESRDPRSTLHALGAETQVGKRGGHLSGGQRARTALARSVFAVLKGASCVLLDDPVASVDNEVVQAAWESAILVAMRSATRVVTVNSQLLERLAPSASRIVILAPGGRIAFDGTPAEAAATGGAIADALGGGRYRFDGDASPEASPSAKPSRAEQNGQHSENGVKGGTTGKDGVFSSDAVGAEKVGAPPEAEKAEQVPATRLSAPSPLQAVGAFTWRTRGLLLVSGAVALVMTMQVPVSYHTIRQWQQAQEAGEIENQWPFLRLYAYQSFGFALLAGLITVAEGLASASLFSTLTSDIDAALSSLGMPYFWSGKQAAEPGIRKVLNMELDKLVGIGRLPVQAGQCLISCLIMCYYAPSFWILVVVAYLGHQRMATVSDWRATQLEPSCDEYRNAFFAKVVEQFDNVLPMRALGRIEDFERSLHPECVSSLYTSFLRFQVETMVTLMNHSIGCLFNTFAVLVVLRMKTDGADPAQIMAAFSFANTVSNMVKDLCGLAMPFKTQLARFHEISDFIRSDLVEVEGQGASAPEAWPTQGALSLEQVTFAYAKGSPPALRELSLEVRAGEKLGIVGRTGSGKSTLANLLLRLAPLEGSGGACGSGRVLLDGVDLATLRLRDVRAAFAVVPQEATVVAGGLKANIGEEYADAEVLTALEWCGLDPRALSGCESLQEALVAPITTGSLSAGQAQLLMAARALAKRPKVLILDECTASLDRESADRLLQVLTDHAGGATTLSIAHRLRFVVSCDRVLTLAGGRVVSLETPAKLLEDPESFFGMNLKLEQEDEVASSAT